MPASCPDGNQAARARTTGYIVNAVTVEIARNTQQVQKFL
jgi:hypothetical protein